MLCWDAKARLTKNFNEISPSRSKTASRFFTELLYFAKVLKFLMNYLQALLFMMGMSAYPRVDQCFFEVF